MGNPRLTTSLGEEKPKLGRRASSVTVRPERPASIPVATTAHSRAHVTPTLPQARRTAVETATAAPPSARFASSFAPSTVRRASGSDAITHAERPSSETDGAAVSDIAAQKPKAHGSAARSGPEIAAACSAVTSTPSIAPEVSRPSSPTTPRATASTTMSTSPTQQLSA